MVAQNNSFITSSFPNFISHKLDDLTFLLWRQQVEPIIKSHRLQRFVANPQIPLQFLTEADHTVGIKNPAYEAWEQQDQVLLTWLQSMLSSLILSCVLRCVHSYEVWERIHNYFLKQTRVTVRQLRTELRVTILRGKLMREFLLQIKQISDSLASVGSPIMLQEHVDSILEGLPPDYDSVISVIESKFEPLPIAEVEALLLAHEARLNKFHK